jgi:hypothetical protein
VLGRLKRISAESFFQVEQLIVGIQLRLNFAAQLVGAFYRGSSR